MAGLSSLGSHKVTAPLKPTAVEESIKKDDTKTLRSLKGKDQALNLEPTTSEDPGVETNEDDDELHRTSDDDAELIARNPASVKKLMHVNQDLQSQLAFLQRQFDSVMTTAQSQTTQPQARTLPGTNATVRTADSTTRTTIPVGGH